MSPEHGPYTSKPQPLSPDDAAGLRLPWSSYLSREDLGRHVGRYPHLSWVLPGTSSYLVSGPWRNRLDVIEVYESRGDKHKLKLWRALLDDPHRTFSAVLIDSAEYRTSMGFYRRESVDVLEEVHSLRTSALPGPTVPLTLTIEPMRTRGLSTLLEIDHSAFDWLWRNSREEFQEYLETPGVTVWIASYENKPVGYVGYTMLGGWGHIDRLAVRPEEQGRGHGAQLLSWALHRLYSDGSRYAQLTTQGSNHQSYPLYQGFGFRQTRGGYKLYGLYV
ncbi:MAG: GNAT family N-acetyltransferase [Chloroflexia bacterium]